MIPAGIEVQVQADRAPRTVPRPLLDLLAEAVRVVLRAEDVDTAEVSLTLLDDAGMRSLNEGWLGHDRATDVIAFSLGEPGAPLGDVYVGLEQADRQAEEHGVEPREELVRLAVHGTLHVLGWDHPEGDDRSGCPMYRRQEELVRAVLRRADAAQGPGGG